MTEKRKPERGLPTNIDAERYILGAILMDPLFYADAASTLGVEDFSLEKHRTIFKSMGAVSESGDRIDRITVANELMRTHSLEACGGISFLLEITEGVTETSDITSHIRIVKDKANLRRLIFQCHSTIGRAMDDVDKSRDIINSLNESLMEIGGSGSGFLVSSSASIFENYPGGMEAFLDPSKKEKGLKTGLLQFDNMTGGLHKGDVIVIGARPSMGKTAWMLNIAQHVAVNQKQPVLIHSMEMSKESLLLRMTCGMARVDSQRFRAGFIYPEERKRLANAVSTLHSSPLYIDDTPGINLMEIRSKAIKLKNRLGDLGLLCVDYLQLMGSHGRTENRTQEVSQMSRGLNLLAKELKVPALVLSQLSRAVEQRKGDHRPQLSDLRESGAVEQDADIVAFIFREEVYSKGRDDNKGFAEIIVAKQRQGPVGTCHCVFLANLTRFENKSEDMEPEAESMFA